MSKKGQKPAFKESQYTPVYLKKQDIKTLASDYTRLRDIMQKRYKRLIKAGFERSNFAQAVKQWGGEIPKLSTLKKMFKGSPEEYKNAIAYWLSELKSYEREENTVKYLKDKTKKLASALKSGGYDIKQSELQDFGDFMDYIRMTGLDMSYYAETYEASDSGYRSRRRERTEEEKKGIVQAFHEYLKNGRTLPVNLMIGQ